MKKIIFGTIVLMVLFGVLHYAHGRSSGLTYHEIQFVDETGAPVTDISSINIYAPDTTTDATIYMDSALSKAITQSITTDSTNTTFTQGSGTLYWWGPDGYDFTFTNGTNIATNAGHRTRTGSEGRLCFPSYLTNITSADYEDGESVSYGSDDDFIANGGTTANLLTFTPVTNGTSAILLGTSASCCDVNFSGDTAGRDLMWDATDNRLEFLDLAIFSIGTGNDYYIAHNGTTTTITGAATHASANIFNADVTFNGTYDVEWDLTRNAMHFLDDAKLELGGDTTAAADVYFAHDGTSLTLYSVAASEPWLIGGATNGFDVTYAFETTGTIATSYTGDTMSFSDQISLVFGSNADASIMYDETTDNNLEIVAASVGMSVTTNDFLATLDGAAADQFKVDATGSVNGDGINLETTDGGIMLNADGASYGDIELNAADDIIITSAGAITVLGETDYQTTFCQFRSAPIVAGDAAGAAATGTAGDENRFITEDGAFEYHVIGTVTACYPVIGGTVAAGGYDISGDDADAEGFEIGQGITARSKHSLVAQTDSGYLEVKLYITDVDGANDIAVGWRKVEGYEADFETYTDMYTLDVVEGDVFIASTINDAGTLNDDTEINTADTTAIVLKVVVATDGTVTSFVNGTEETEHQAEFTFDSGDVLVPFLYFINNATIAEDTYLMEWKCQID